MIAKNKYQEGIKQFIINSQCYKAYKQKCDNIFQQLECISILLDEMHEIVDDIKNKNHKIIIDIFVNILILKENENLKHWKFLISACNEIDHNINNKCTLDSVQCIFQNIETQLNLLKGELEYFKNKAKEIKNATNIINQIQK